MAVNFQEIFDEIAAEQKPRIRYCDATRLGELRKSDKYKLAYSHEEPLVSVIIPTFNRAELVISRTLPSVLKQTYQNIEVIIVGDGMSPDQAAILEGGLDLRVRFYNLKKRGRYPERALPKWYVAGVKPANFGLRVASGLWIVHLDDDDELLPGFIEVMLKLARQNQAEWVHGKVEFRRENGSCECIIGDQEIQQGNITRISSIYNAALKTFRYNQYCWRYAAPADWDLWDRFEAMGVQRTFYPSVVAIHHGPIFAAGSNESAALLKEEGDGGYQEWIAHHALQEIDAQLFAERMLLHWQQRPVFHLLMPLVEGQLTLLADTIDSLGVSLYNQWHLTVVAPFPSPDDLFDELPMLRWIESSRENILLSLNDAVSTVGADWFSLIQPGMRLEPHTLLRLGDYINLKPAWLLIYADDDCISSEGGRHSPRFKPDFNLDMLRSTDYIGTVFVKREALTKLDGMAFLMPGVENYDLALRLLDAYGELHIGHIADVLFHEPEMLPVDLGAALCLALRQHLTRNDIDGEVLDGYLPNTFRIAYRHSERASVSIIIPNKDKVEFLEPCLDSLLEKTCYPAYEIIIVDNQSSDPDLFDYYDKILRAHPGKIRVIDYPHGFNYSAICNLAVREAKGDYVLFLNNDTQILHAEWLERMMAHAQRPEVGVVGARLCYPETGKLQHAGVIVGLDAVAEHVFIDQLGLDEPGYMNRALIEQNYTAVTGACQLVRKSLYEAVGGQDDVALTVSYNDIDLCLKIVDKGYKVVWSPFATLVHHGSVSQKSGIVDLEKQAQKHTRFKRERETMMDRWLPKLAHDPAYNPNLSLIDRDMRLEVQAPLNWDTNFHDRTRVLGLPLAGGSGDYRIIQPFKALSQAGAAQCEYIRFPKGKGRTLSVTELARQAPDVFVVHAALNDVEIVALEYYRRYLPEMKVVFMLDDLVTKIPEKSSAYKNFMRHFRDARSRLRKSLALSDRLIVTTKNLAQVCEGMIDDIRIVPNRLLREPWTSLISLRQQGLKPRVGWAGAQQHAGDLELIEPVVKALADEVEWIFMGMCPEGIRQHVKEFHDFVAIAKYPAKLASLNLDLAIAPLEMHPFNESKSNLRLLEYGALGWPVVCTDIAPYRDYDAPVTRLPNDAEIWISTIREKLAEPSLLAEEGDRLQAWVRQHFILEDHLDDWQQALMG